LTKGRIAGVHFSQGQCRVTPTSREHCSRLQQSRCHAVIDGCTTGVKLQPKSLQQSPTETEFLAYLEVKNISGGNEFGSFYDAYRYTNNRP